MSETIVHALVLKRRDQGESDRRLTVLTEEMGKLDIVAKGARKAASRLAGVSDPLSVAKLGLALGKVNRFIIQAQPRTSFPGLRTDFDRLTMGLAYAELVATTTPYEQPDPELFLLAIRSLQVVERHDKPLVAFVWAQVALLAQSGFLPELDRCVETGQALTEGAPFLSPQAGGYVSDTAPTTHSDRYRVRAEVLINLQRLVPLETCPPNLKFAEETLEALYPFWRRIAEGPLPALESTINGTRVRRMEAGVVS